VLLAHIAGMPIEETALSFGPVIAAGGGIATLRLRDRFARRRPRGRPVIRTSYGAASISTPIERTPMGFRALIHANRSITATIPRWALPFYWCAAACVLLFSGVIWLVARICMSMRPLYEARR
jgi:hypothetical protein